MEFRNKLRSLESKILPENNDDIKKVAINRVSDSKKYETYCVQAVKKGMIPLMDEQDTQVIEWINDEVKRLKKLPIHEQQRMIAEANKSKESVAQRFRLMGIKYLLPQKEND